MNSLKNHNIMFRKLYTKCLDRKSDKNISKKCPIKFLSDKEQIQKLIFNGPYSDVWRIISSRENISLGLKVIHKDKLTLEYQRKFLPRELHIIRRLHHVNIPVFFQTIELKTKILIMMEFAAHGNLLNWIIDNKYVKEPRACRWFHHLVNGVNYIHSLGIVHRDLKTENLLLDDHHILKITDFGYSRKYLPESEECSSNKSTSYCGSLSYAAPEILTGTPYNPRSSDIWSMGVILYVMVFGSTPFDESNFKNLLYQIKSKVEFPESSSVSSDCKLLILNILKPEKERINIEKIKKSIWYNSMWKTEWNEELLQEEKRYEEMYKGIKVDHCHYGLNQQSSGIKSLKQNRNSVFIRSDLHLHITVSQSDIMKTSNDVIENVLEPNLNLIEGYEH